MAVIREQRQFGISPVRVVRADTGGQLIGQAMAQAGETFSDIMFKRAAVQAEKAGKEAALSVEAEKVVTFDPITQKPVAHTLPKPFGTIAAEAYQNVINQRFNQEIESDIKLRAAELASQFQNSPNGSELYKQAMDDYVNQLKENAGGMYGEYISGVGTDYTEMTYLNLKENEKARARAQQVAAMNDNNLDVISQVQAAAAQVGAQQAAEMFPETALSLGAAAGLSDSSSDKRIREAYRIALAQGDAEYIFDQAVNSGLYTAEELQLNRVAISTNSGYSRITIPPLQQALAPFSSNYSDWSKITGPLLDTFNNLIVERTNSIQFENMAVVSRITTRPMDFGLDPNGYFTDPPSSIGMLTEAAQNWKAISTTKPYAWQQDSSEYQANYNAAQRNYFEAIDTSISAYTLSLPSGIDGVEEALKLQTVIQMGGRGREDLSEASRTLLSQMEAVDGVTGLKDFESALLDKLGVSQNLLGEQEQIDNFRAAQAEEAKQLEFGNEYTASVDLVAASIKTPSDTELIIEALRTKDTENLPAPFKTFVENIINLGQQSGSDEYINRADEYVNSLRTIFEAREQRRVNEQSEIEAANNLAAEQKEAINENKARNIVQETRAEIFNASSIEEVEALRQSAINGLESTLGGREDNAFLIGLKNRIEDVTAEVYVRSILTTADNRGEFMTLMYALGGDERALNALKDDPRLEQIKKAREYGSVDTDSYSSNLSRISRDLIDQANTIEAQFEYQLKVDIILNGFGNPESAEDQTIAEQVLGPDFTDRLIDGRINPTELNVARNAPPTGLINSLNTIQNQPIERQLELLNAYSQLGFIESRGQLIQSRAATAIDPSAVAYMDSLQQFLESSGATTQQDMLFHAEQFRQVRTPEVVEKVNRYYQKNPPSVDGEEYSSVNDFLAYRFYEHGLNNRTMQYIRDRFYMDAVAKQNIGQSLDLKTWAEGIDMYINADLSYDPRVWDGGIWPADFEMSDLSTSTSTSISFILSPIGVPTKIQSRPTGLVLQEGRRWAKTEFGLVKTLGGEEQAALFEQYVAQTVGHDRWVLRPASNVSSDGGVVYEVLDVTSGVPNPAIARSGGRNEPELIVEPIYVSTRGSAFSGLKVAAEKAAIAANMEEAEERLSAPVTQQDQNIIERTVKGFGAFFGGRSRSDQALSDSISTFGNTFSSQIETLGVGDRSTQGGLISGGIGSLDRYKTKLETALATTPQGTPRYNEIQNLLGEIQKINELHGR